MEEKKWCYRCDTIKAVEEFWKCKRSKDGLQSHCIDCDKRRDKTKSPQSRRIYNLRAQASRYGTTTEYLELLLLAQDSKCAICKTTDPAGSNKSWNLDHDHACCGSLRKATKGNWGCGKCIRGFLCWPCNIVVGLVENGWNIQISEVIEYLEKYRGSR